MIMRGILGLAVALALAACADGGFVGRTGQFSGVWLYEFEGSMFVEGAASFRRSGPHTRKPTGWSIPLTNRTFGSSSRNGALMKREAAI